MIMMKLTGNIRKRHITKSENMWLYCIQIVCLAILLFFFMLKCDRWFFNGRFEISHFNSHTSIDYKFPLLDAYWQRCSYTDFVFAFFLIDWFANIGLILGVFTRKYVLTSVSTFVLFICFWVNIPCMLERVFNGYFEYLGFDPGLDLIMYAIGYIATVLFMTFEFDGFYDWCFGELTDDIDASE